MAQESDTGEKSQEEIPGLSPLAYEEIPGEEYPPYVPAATKMAELTVKSVVLGALVGMVFGAANAYLGLRVGLTVSASIPAAVTGVAVFRILGGTILETNTVQTIGSAGESLAAGVIFTLAGLYIWNLGPSMMTIFTIAALGGLLGVLFMIPLRRLLIVSEHGKLPYPEGSACAEVLVAGQRDFAKVKALFTGLGVGGLYQTLMHSKLFKLWNEEPTTHVPGFQGAEIGAAVTPELLGVGFIIGPRIAAIMFAGGALGWLVIIPLITMLGQGLTEPLYPATTLISTMEPIQIWNKYVRYIGAGAVAVGGFITLLKSLPMIWSSVASGLQGLRERGTSDEGTVERTMDDLPMKFVIGGVVIIVIVLALLPSTIMPAGVLGASLMAVFAFFFVTVSSRIVGLIGSSSNPVSGMTIATLLVTALIFVALGKADMPNARFAVLAVGAVVCIAAAIAGDTSQDLKTGFLVGATPRYQQIGEFVGVIAAALVMGFVLNLLDSAYGIGSQELAAPQATIMTLVIDGVLQANLPWNFVIIGGVISVVVEMLGLPSLALAVGLYLPISLSTPIVAGGAIRGLLKKRYEKDVDELRERREQGVLYSSGLIAGAALVGVGAAGLVALSQLADPEGGGFGATMGNASLSLLEGMQGVGGWVSETLTAGFPNMTSVIVFSLLAASLAYMVFWRKPGTD